MMVLTNKPVEHAQKLYRSAVSPVELQEDTGSRALSREDREDSVSISPEAAAKVMESANPKSSDEKSEEKSEKKGTDGKPLSDEEKKSVEKLKARDREVKAHEQAHIAAGGGHIRGGASYDYQTGPDGSQYAVGGNVDIDTSSVSGDPDATIQKMQSVRAAAMAPADPSGQDHSVAASASAAIANAMAEKASASSEEKTEERAPSEKSDKPSKAESSVTAYSQTLSVSGSRLNMVG